MPNLTKRVNEEEFDKLFKFEFATSEESAKKMAEIKKKAIHQDDVMNIGGKLYYVDYPDYDSYTNPEPKPVLYEMK